MKKRIVCIALCLALLCGLLSTGALAESDTFVTVSYTEGDLTMTAAQEITVTAAEKTLTGIRITANPDRYTDYVVGELFDPTGMVVVADYSDGSSAEVTGYTWTPDGALTRDDTFVTVSYTEGGITVTGASPIIVWLANPFADVDKSDYFYDAVLWAYYAEPFITNGKIAPKTASDGTFETLGQFGPVDTVTRGQAMTFLWRAMGEPEPETEKNPFADVKETAYYYKAVLWAVEKGITTGTDATHFRPEDTCSTAHIVTFLYRTITGKTVGGKDWYQVPAAWAEDWELLDVGITVAPDVNCPRCEVVYFLWRVLA